MEEQTVAPRPPLSRSGSAPLGLHPAISPDGSRRAAEFTGRGDGDVSDVVVAGSSAERPLINLRDRKGWSTQQLLLQWGGERASLHAVDMVAQNLSGRWAKGGTLAWEKKLLTATPEEAQTKLEVMKVKAQEPPPNEFGRNAKQEVSYQCERLSMWNTATKRRLLGGNRPMRKDLPAFLSRKPQYEEYNGQDVAEELKDPTTTTQQVNPTLEEKRLPKRGDHKRELADEPVVVSLSGVRAGALPVAGGYSLPWTTEEETQVRLRTEKA